MISFLKFLRGYLKICFTGANVERFFNMCAHNHILIWNLCVNKNEYVCCVSRKSMPMVKDLAVKTGTKMEIRNKCGLPFLLYRHRKRRIFGICCICAFIMLYAMSFFLWDITIKGNESYSTAEIMNYVTKHYAHGGQLLSTIDTLALEEELRTHFEKFAWVSCEINGTQLTIHIKETINLKVDNKAEKPSDLLANKSGVISSIITRAGTPMVKAGDTVKKGDVLISGVISYQNDAKEVYEEDYVPADGDIIAETYYDYEDTISMQYYEKKYEEKEKAGYELHLFGKDYKIYTPKTDGDKVDTEEKIYHFKLGKTFYFPISLTKTTYRYYSFKRVSLTEAQAKELANTHFKAYCKKLSKKGVEIVGNNVKISMSGEKMLAKGKIKVLEPIGKISLIDTTKKENVNEHSGETD